MILGYKGYLFAIDNLTGKTNYQYNFKWNQIERDVSFFNIGLNDTEFTSFIKTSFLSLYGIFIGGAVIILFIVFSMRVNRKSQERKARLNHLEKNGSDILITILSMKPTDFRLEDKFILDLKLQVENKADNSSWIIENYKERAARLAMGTYHKDTIYLGKMGDSREELIFVKDESERPVPAPTLK